MISWRVPEDAFLNDILVDALRFVPREHLRQLDRIDIYERDPRGAALGVWRQDNNGTRIELYTHPHLSEMARVPQPVRNWALRLFLSHTVFHEVGHHVTRVLNKRAMPRQSVRADAAVEKWAEDYAFKRLQKWANGLTLTPEDRKAFATALHVLRLEQKITLPGTNPMPSPSSMQSEMQHGGN